MCDAGTFMTGAFPRFFNAPLALFLRPTLCRSGCLVGFLSEPELQERHDDPVQAIFEPAALPISYGARPHCRSTRISWSAVPANWTRGGYASRRAGSGAVFVCR